MYLSPFIQGFAVSAGLIVAIGAQNAHVLALGIKRHHPLPAALVCSLCDALLTVAGVMGMGLILKQFPNVTQFAFFAGAAFLGVYGLQALGRALRPQVLLINDAMGRPSLKKVIASTLVVTLLNPHVYLDTMVLIGTLSGQYLGHQKVSFTIGAVLASLCWFLALSWGAAKLRGVFQSQRAWRFLDLVIATIMLALAAALARSGYHFQAL